MCRQAAIPQGEGWSLLLELMMSCWRLITLFFCSTLSYIINVELVQMKLNKTGAEANSQLIESYITILIFDCCYLSSRNAKYLLLPASQILKCSAFLCYTVYIIL